MGQKYQCCFCGETIQPVEPDVGGLRYTTCIDQEAGRQKDQFFFCHTACFSSRLRPGPGVHLYVLDLLNGAS
jgi:hypothetical protein